VCRVGVVGGGRVMTWTMWDGVCVRGAKGDLFVSFKVTVLGSLWFAKPTSVVVR